MISFRPLLSSDLQFVYSWLLDFPLASFDDFGPHDYAEFQLHMLRRMMVHRIVFVLSDGEPVGVIGYQRLTPFAAIFRGICFAKSVHRSGIPQRAVQQLFYDLRSDGIRTMFAEYFADSVNVQRFLRGFGSRDLGTVGRTKRNGSDIDIVKVAISLADICVHERSRDDQKRSDASANLSLVL